MIKPNNLWPLSFKAALDRAGFVVNDEMTDILWGCVHQAADDWRNRLRELLQDADVEFEEADYQLLLSALIESTRIITTVEDNYRNIKLARDNESLRKLLMNEAIQEMLSHYIMRGFQTYATWHNVTLEQLEITEVRWGPKDEMIVIINHD